MSTIDYGKTKIKAAKFVNGALKTATAVAVTFTAANPGTTPDGALTIANGGTPTVVELLHYCLELNTKIDQLQKALKV